jgi:hypothetical protein
LRGIAGKRRSDLAIGAIEKADLVAISIGGNWSTQRTSWQIRPLLGYVEVDCIWMEACKNGYQLFEVAQVNRATYRETMKVVMLGKRTSLC